MQEVRQTCVQGEWLHTKVYANANTAAKVFIEQLCQALHIMQAVFKVLNQWALSYHRKLFQATQRGRLLLKAYNKSPLKTLLFFLPVASVL